VTDHNSFSEKKKAEFPFSHGGWKLDGADIGLVVIEEFASQEIESFHCLPPWGQFDFTTQGGTRLSLSEMALRKYRLRRLLNS
jgi:hypothetical protein